MAEPPRNSPYLTPTYQTTLMKAVMDVIIARNLRDIEAQWTCLETLYFVAPEVVMKEIGKEIETIREELHKIRVTDCEYNSAQQKLFYKYYNYKKMNADRFFNIIMNSMRRNKYTEIDTSVRPKFETKGVL